MEENDEDVKGGDRLKLSTPLAKRRLSIAMAMTIKDVHIILFLCLVEPDNQTEININYRTSIPQQDRV